VAQNEIQKTAKRRIKIGLMSLAQHIDRMCSTESTIAPPRTLYHQYGGGNFFDIGLHFFRIMLDECNLQRTSKILDVGCGVGRIALPLQYFLKNGGCYDGFDIMPEGIEFCSTQVTPKFPNFNFQKADIFNSFYNPSGSQKAEEYSFPYPSASFDIVLSTSLMTHLPPAAAVQYIRETARVLKPGGISLHTFFVLDQFASKQISAGHSAIKFRYDMGGYLTSNIRAVEDAIALPEGLVRNAYTDAGLDLQIKYGSWCGRPNPLSAQDIVLGRK
jgi:SAM-dependent methyltransferase